MAPTLLATKLFMPPPRLALVARPRLSERLGVGLACKLTLVVAPAGFGKTTAASAWLNPEAEAGAAYPFVRRPAQAAWVSLDDDDNDPARFWSYVAAALDALAPGVAEPALALLHAPQPAPITAALTGLINGLSALGDDAVLVLDDFHVISAPAIHDALAFLLDHLPPRLHLLITSRAEPPLPLARLRARGQLAELRVPELRFTPNEAAAFLTDVMGLPLAPADVAALEERTEGWIAGLQLAALAMRDRGDASRFLTALATSSRFVFDYLAEEVFARQPAHLQTFLLQTAMLDRLCGELCDAVLGLQIADCRLQIAEQNRAISNQQSAISNQAYSQIILEQLDTSNLFLVPLDETRMWYRYHHLFGAFLRERLLRGAMAGELAKLHRRAGAWCEQHGLLDAAMSHALASDYDWAARLLAQHALPTLLNGQAATLENWLGAFPPPLWETYPQLPALQASMEMTRADYQAAIPHLAQARAILERQPPQPDSAEVRQIVEVMELVLGCISGDTQALAAARNLLSTLNPKTPMRNMLVFGAGYGEYLVGNLPAAEMVLVTALEQQTPSDKLRIDYYALLTFLAMVRHAQGRLRASDNLCREVIQGLTRDGQLLYVPNVGLALNLRAAVACEWNNLDEAEGYLQQCLEIARQQGVLAIDYAAFCFLGRVRRSQGRFAEAGELLQRAEEAAHQQLDPGNLLHLIESERVIQALREGDVAAATELANRLLPSPNAQWPPLTPFGEGRVALALLALAQRRWSDTHALLASLATDAEASGHGLFQIWSLVLDALGSQAEGQRAQAMRTIERAVRLAAPEGYVRLFVDEGEPMRLLIYDLRLTLLKDGDPLRPYLDGLLAAFSSGAASPAPIQHPKSSFQNLVEPLTERELEVLRLIAQGHSNQQIADALIVSVGTVKKHLNNIFGKLDAQSRTQAVARAREGGLL